LAYKVLKKIQVKFPGGAGGNWLRHLCYCLENNNIDTTNTDLNFHNQIQSDKINCDHFLENYDILLSTTCKFNLFLNALIKNKIYNIPDNWFENAAHYVNQSRYHMSDDWKKVYETNIDLDISLMVKDSKKFTYTLFELLKKFDFKFYPNESLVDIKIKEFMKTCPNPYDFIGNVNNKYWQVWCLGFMNVEEVLIKYYNVQQVIDKIKENNDYYSKITMEWSFA